jgi:exoribonuclease II
MTSPTRIYMDNKSAIQLCEIFKINHKVRHINIRINYIRELINNKVIELHFIASNFNVADVLTKPLASESFHQHSNILLYGFKANNLERILSNHHTHLVFNVVDNTYEIRRVC